MQLEKKLDNLHLSVIENVWLQRFTAFTRILLAIGFTPPSIIKILGKPFTVLPDSNPVGHYFNALYQTGFYYQFIGWAQLTAVILLIFPRTAHIGAMLFLPIILNITVLTSSVGFAGTWLITDLMFLAALYLVCWDYDRLKPLLFLNRSEKVAIPKIEFLWLPILGAFGGIFTASFFAYFKVADLQENFAYILLVLSVAGFLFGLICSLHHKFMRVGKLTGKSHIA